VDSQKFRGGGTSPRRNGAKLNHALHELVQAPLYIDDTPGAHLMDMHAKTAALRRASGITWGW